MGGGTPRPLASRGSKNREAVFHSPVFPVAAKFLPILEDLCGIIDLSLSEEANL